MSMSGSFALVFTVISLQVVFSQIAEHINENEPDVNSCSSYSREEVSGLVELIAANHEENANKIKAVKELLASNSSAIDELAKMVRVIASNQQENSKEMKKIASNLQGNAREIEDVKGLLSEKPCALVSNFSALSLAENCSTSGQVANLFRVAVSHQQQNAKEISDLKELLAGNSSVLDDIVNAVKRLSSNQENVASEIQQISSIQQETAQEIRNIKSNQRENAQKISDLKELLAGNSSVLDDIVNAVKRLTSNQENVVSEIQQISSTQQETAQEIKNIKSNQRENTEKISDVKELLAGNSSVLDDIVAAVKTITSNLENVVSEIKQISSIQQETVKEIKKIASAQQEQENVTISTAKPCVQPPKQALISTSANFCIPLLIQQNILGSNVFNRSWAEYKVGFNDSSGNYWLGNELIHQLTLKRRYNKLRFDMKSRAGGWYIYEYSTVKVLPESSNYRVVVGGFWGGSYNQDAFGYRRGSNNMMFSTYDRDNDQWSSGNCAEFYGGGFWYNSCGQAYPNSDYNNFYWSGVAMQLSRIWLLC